jgi:hypothetical protein
MFSTKKSRYKKARILDKILTRYLLSGVSTQRVGTTVTSNYSEGFQWYYKSTQVNVGGIIPQNWSSHISPDSSFIISCNIIVLVHAF